MSEKRTDFVIRIAGPAIRPWAVPLRSLTRLLDAVQRLVDQKDDDQQVDESNQDVGHVDPRTLHLLNVKVGSAVYEVAAPNRETALRVITDVGRAIENPNNVDWAASTLSSLRELSEVAKSMKCTIEFREPGTRRPYGNVIAKIVPATYELIEPIAFIDGRTSVYAKIERVGGATEMHCGIRLPESPRKMIICRVVSMDLVRQLGQFMYQCVVLTGNARWLRHNWALKHLVIDEFEPPKCGSILQTLKDAHDAGGHVWDKIDNPAKLIAEMRGP